MGGDNTVHRPKKPEIQLAICWLLVLGAKLSTLSARDGDSGVLCLVSGNVFPLGLLIQGVFGLGLSRGPKRTDFGVRRSGEEPATEPALRKGGCTLEADDLVEQRVDGVSNRAGDEAIGLGSKLRSFGEGRKSEFVVVKVDGDDINGMVGSPTFTHGRTV